MSQQTIVYPQPPTTNETIDLNRSNKFKAARVKKIWTNKIATLSEDLVPYSTPIWLGVKLTFPNNNCDPDNLFGCLKFVLDGLQQAEIIVNDNAKWLKGIYYIYEKAEERSVTLTFFDDPVEYRAFVLANLIKSKD